MKNARHTIYLDPILEAAVKHTAARDGRSMSKQVEFLLRQALDMPVQSTRLVDPLDLNLNRPAKPDPKAKVLRKATSRT